MSANDLRFQVFDDSERKIFDGYLDQLRKKMAEKERRRPVGIKKKAWKKRKV